jgi:predicted ATP-dependent serine protease
MIKDNDLLKTLKDYKSWIITRDNKATDDKELLKIPFISYIQKYSDFTKNKILSFENAKQLINDDKNSFTNEVPFNAVGFNFVNTDVVFIDIDNKQSDDNQSKINNEIITAFKDKTYAELSQSKTGYHIYFRLQQKELDLLNSELKTKYYLKHSYYEIYTTISPRYALITFDNITKFKDVEFIPLDFVKTHFLDKFMLKEIKQSSKVIELHRSEKTKDTQQPIYDTSHKDVITQIKNVVKETKYKNVKEYLQQIIDYIVFGFGTEIDKKSEVDSKIISVLKAFTNDIYTIQSIFQNSKLAIDRQNDKANQKKYDRIDYIQTTFDNCQAYEIPKTPETQNKIKNKTEYKSLSDFFRAKRVTQNIIDNMKLPDYLYPDFVTENSMNIIYSMGGVGKSTLMYNICKILVDKNVLCMYIDNDNNKSTYKSRNFTKLNDIILLNDVDYRTEFDFVRQGIDKINESNLNKKIFLVIDSLYIFCPDLITNEVTESFMSDFRGLTNQYQNLTVFIIHHTAKDGTLKGNTNFFNAVDNVYFIEGNKQNVNLYFNVFWNREKGGKSKTLYSQKQDITFCLNTETNEFYQTDFKPDDNTILIKELKEKLKTDILNTSEIKDFLYNHSIKGTIKQNEFLAKLSQDKEIKIKQEGMKKFYSITKEPHQTELIKPNYKKDYEV